MQTTQSSYKLAHHLGLAQEQQIANCIIYGASWFV